MNTDIARIEYKFHLTQEEFLAVLPEIEGRLGPDRVANVVRYPIVSEYWDSPNRDIYWERMRGLKERRKFRIRIYGTADGAIPPAAFLEVKHKSLGRGVKRRLPWNVATLGHVQEGMVEQLSAGMADCERKEQNIRNEILLLVERRKLEPACQIRYDRMAYEGGGAEEEFRITFDTDIRCRMKARVLVPDCHDFPLEVSSPGVHVMEVKAHRVMPYWMRNLIGRHHLLPRGFSKYGTAMELHDPVLRGKTRAA
ncbi:MAG: polyphosphate polymerase domain-containing protein [Verrucomicrobiales bacterium]